MIMHHMGFSSYFLVLLVSIFFLFSLFSLMQGLKVGSLNINGGRDQRKRALVKEVFQQKKLDVILLQETHSDQDNEVDWGLWWEGSYILSHGTNFSGGVAILFAPGMDVNILSSNELVKGRALAVKTQIEGLELTFINVYAPNQGSDRLAFFGLLKVEIEKLNLDLTCMGGDWNCTLKFTMDRMNEEPHPLSSGALSRLVTRLDLVDVWRVKHPDVKQYTWVRVNDNRISAARLDRIYLSQSLSSRLTDSSICPVGFTDHHLTMANVSLSPGMRFKSYWHFNTKLLQDNAFCQSFGLFWTEWRGRKTDFETLSQWWDVGKAQIRLFCQQYTAFSTARVKAAVQQLENDIKDLERGLGTDDRSGDTVLGRKRQELGTFLQERVKGALVRSRFLSIRDMDAPTSFFFNLEKREAIRKTMTCLKLPGGRVTTDPGEMRRHAVEFYSGLFGAEDCDVHCTEELLEGLPQLSPRERDLLDIDLSLEELTTAVDQMASGRSPGLDGLPIDFFKTLWNIIGPDLHEVFLDCLKSGLLPVSCRRAVLSLLPKKGDLALLKNWRPVALLCTDYKVLSRALSNRLKEHLAMLVHMDQTYCVPGRTIMDNIFLMRDVLNVCDAYDLDLGVVSLDQEKAFDKLDHSYLFSVLKAFGFGDGFRSWIGLLYSGATCMVKVGGGLSRPISVQRGIRQGCPLSGQLYSLAIEPLVSRLRSRIKGLSLPGMQSSPPLTVTAYADDVNIFIKDQEDVQVLVDSLALYEKASSATVNWAKCEALRVGRWRGRAVPCLPGGLQWGRNGMKVLGVYLGTEGFQKQNWEGVLEKVCAKLSKWKWLLPQLSYRGRVLVANNLIASTLWHRLVVLPPPSGLTEEIQRLLVNFFWSGQHWIRAAALYLPVEEGGQGLVDIKSRVLAFRLAAAQRLLYQCGARWLDTAELLLRRVGRLGYGRQLFLTRLQEVDLNGLSPFYSSVLQAWQVLEATRDPEETPGRWLFEEPLFYNSFIEAPTLSSASLRSALREAGCVKLGQLLKATETSVELLGQMARIRSSRLLNRVVEEVVSSLPEPMQRFLENCTPSQHWDEEGEYRFPSLSVGPAVGEWEEGEESFLSFAVPQLGEFEEMGKKEAYQVCVKVGHLRSLEQMTVSRWSDVIGPGKSPKGCWRVLYKLPVEKRAADLQWRIVHGAIATNRHIAHLDPSQGVGCGFCGQAETIAHLFLQCSRLEGLFRLLRGLFFGFGESFSWELFVFGPRYAAKKKESHVLINFLSAMAKLAIWLTRKNKTRGVGSVDPVEVMRGLVAARLRVEHAYHKTVDNLEGFNSRWTVGGVLCTLGEQGELKLSF